MSQSRTAIFVHIVRYRLLCGKILTALHCSNRSIRKSETSVRGARNDLAVELEDWRLNIRSLGLPEIDLSMPNAETRSSFRSKAWYELLYHNAVLLLHRPSSATTPVPLDTGDLQRMFSSAEQAITLYSYLFRSSRINFSWSTLHACFIAGLSYVYTVSRHMREKRRQILSRVSGPTVSLQHDPSVMEITNVCRACSNILVAVTERCNAQKSSNVVFERLSDAVLADAVDLLVSSAVSKRMEQVTGRPLAQIVDGPATQSVNVHQVSNAEISLGAQEYFQVFKDVRFGPSADTQMVDPAHADYGLVGRSISAEPLLAADNALRDCFPDLQRMYDTHWGDDAIMQLGIDWLAEIDPTISGRTETTMNANFS